LYQIADKKHILALDPGCLPKSGKHTFRKICLRSEIAKSQNWSPTSFDQSVYEKSVAGRAPVVGLDAPKYFWQARTPDKTAAEINKVLRCY